jgi:hypothetical protein
MEKIASITPQGVKEFGFLLGLLPFLSHLEIENGLVSQAIGSSSKLGIDLTKILGSINIQILVDKELVKKLKNIPEQNSDFDLFENDDSFTLRGHFCDIKIAKVNLFQFSTDQFAWDSSPSCVPILSIDVASGSPESKAFITSVIGKGPAVIELLDGGDWRIRGGKGSIYRGTPQDLVTDKTVMRALCTEILPQIKGGGGSISIHDSPDSASQRPYLVAEIAVGSGLTIKLKEEVFELFTCDDY